MVQVMIIMMMMWITDNLVVDNLLDVTDTMFDATPEQDNELRKKNTVSEKVAVGNH